MAKNKFDWSRIVAVGPTPYNFQLQFSHIFSNFASGMVPGPIKQDDSIAYPVRIFRVQLPGEVPQKEHEDVTVGDGLGKGEVDLSFSIKGGDQGQSRSHGL